ncbi:hypothetical protein ACIBHX_46480 [Nonomuraea sp. NPDC050536]|uniref:hypothetical protein n=1 Tax=Nonomuraea sp. NPDC050536 TaxID=3364366 RepID=UPI0037CA5CC9
MTAVAAHARLAELPCGSVKIPLGLPRGAAWPVVAQIAALSQRAAGCTASIGYLAGRLDLHPSTVYEALVAAEGWVVTETRGRVTRRWLAAIPAGGAWVRISYRAAAGVGCHSVDGRWTARRNRSLLLELYCQLRRDEAIGRVRDQSALAAALAVTDRTVRSLLRTLECDGWITARRSGRLIAWRTHDAPLYVASCAGTDEQGPDSQEEPERSRNLTRNDLGTSGETISEADAVQKREPEAGCEKRDDPPLAVGAAGVGEGGDRDALSRERPTDLERQDLQRPRVPGAPSVVTAIPLEWQIRMTADERDRLVGAIEQEMSSGRSVAEMLARVRRRLKPWCGQRPRRAIAAALIVIRRGYDCPRPDCEDHLLPSGHPCGACAELGAEVNRERRTASLTSRSAVGAAAEREEEESPRTSGWQPPRVVGTAAQVRDDGGEQAHRGAALARCLLQAKGLPA